MKPGCPAMTRNEDGTIRIDDTMCTGCGLCQEKCPSKKNLSEFNRGLSNRTAIYTTVSAQAVPNVPVIDTANCIHFKPENAVSAPKSVQQVQ